MNEQNMDRIPRNCGLKIKAAYGTLKTAERKAADFILENPDEVMDLMIVDYANRAECSEATIVRLAKRLGYKGFPDLKADFADLKKGDDVGLDYQGINKKDSAPDIFRKVIDATIDALRDTLHIMDKSQYVKALKSMLNAPNVLFCGVGDATLVAMAAYQRFVRIGQPCCCSEDPDLQLIMASHLRKGDVAIAISHSGKSSTVVNTIKMAKQAGATAIAITNFPVSPLTKNSDIVLLTAVFTQHVTGEVLSKRVAELCIVESLYINYLLQKGASAIRMLTTSNDAVKVNKLWT
ncbi:MAG TPA: MurR/RpiR family transcriptional regulator [Spirochaetia bacterium]|nr:MurR/RpiR family transcriptional regulator [Spirochaetia bacterium]